MRIPYKLKRAKHLFHRALFNAQFRSVLDARPLARKPSSIAAVTMVSSADLLMYLLAIRSFCAQCPVGDIIVLDDGSLSRQDHDTLRRHLVDPIIMPIAAVNTGSCPRGGCWERLLHILDLSANRYVIQIDSDVLTLGPIPEVLDAIESNAAFTLSSGEGEQIVDLEAASRQVAGADPTHVQIRAEQILRSLPAAVGTHYVRGSAGFAGFAAGGPGRARAEAFSAAMQGQIGETWSRWGTEQVASNFIVSNSPGARLLPWNRYRCFYGVEPPQDIALLHFIGTWRYDQGVFRAAARRTLASITA